MKPQNLKQTEIGKIPTEWEIVKLKDLCEKIISGGTPLTSHAEYYGGTIPWLRTQEVNFGRIYQTEINISEPGLSNSSAKLIPKNSVIIAMYGATAGKVAINKISLATNQACCNLIINSKLADYEYIYYFLMNNYKWLLSQATGAAQQNLNVGQISEINLPLPPLPVQLSIASILSSLDAKIELNNKMNKTLEAIGQALFKKWFVDNPERNNWKKYNFIDLVFHIKPGTNYQPKRIIDGVPFVNVRNIQNGFLSLKDVKYISTEEYRRVHQSWTPEENDILITRIGTLGNVGVIRKEDLPVAVHYNSINIKQKDISYQFLYFLLNSSFFQEQYHLKKKQSVQEYITIEEVEKIKISFPKDLIKIIGKEKMFISLFNQIRANYTQSQTLAQIRDALLPKLMRGEVRVR